MGPYICIHVGLGHESALLVTNQNLKDRGVRNNLDIRQRDAESESISTREILFCAGSQTGLATQRANAHSGDNCAHPIRAQLHHLM